MHFMHRISVAQWDLRRIQSSNLQARVILGVFSEHLILRSYMSAWDVPRFKKLDLWVLRYYMRNVHNWKLFQLP